VSAADDRVQLNAAGGTSDRTSGHLRDVADVDRQPSAPRLQSGTSARLRFRRRSIASRPRRHPSPVGRVGRPQCGALQRCPCPRDHPYSPAPRHGSCSSPNDRVSGRCARLADGYQSSSEIGVPVMRFKPRSTWNSTRRSRAGLSFRCRSVVQPYLSEAGPYGEIPCGGACCECRGSSRQFGETTLDVRRLWRHQPQVFGRRY